MGIEGESAQRAAQPRHFEEHLLRVAALGNPQMPESGQAGVHGVLEPEIGQVARRKLAAAGVAERSALGFQNFDQPPDGKHQPFAGADLQAGRNEIRIEDEVACAVALNAGDGQGDGIGRQLRFQQKADVFAPDGDGARIRAAGFVMKLAGFGKVAGFRQESTESAQLRPPA